MPNDGRDPRGIVELVNKSFIRVIPAFAILATFVAFIFSALPKFYEETLKREIAGRNEWNSLRISLSDDHQDIYNLAVQYRDCACLESLQNACQPIKDSLEKASISYSDRRISLFTRADTISELDAFSDLFGEVVSITRILSEGIDTGPGSLSCSAASDLIDDLERALITGIPVQRPN